MKKGCFCKKTSITNSNALTFDHPIIRPGGLGSEVGSWIRIFLKKISARGEGDAYSNSELNPPRKRFAVSIFDVGEA